MKSSSEKNTIWIAIPYYCVLLMPKRGLSRIYFFAQVDLERRRVNYQTMKIWPGQQFGRLARWLREQGARGVLSADQAPKYELELREEGLWHWHAQADDIDELISTWIDFVEAQENAYVAARQMIGGHQGNASENRHISTRSDAIQ